MKGILLVLVLLVTFVSQVFATEICQNPITVSSSSTGTQVVPKIKGGMTAYVKDGSVGGVWIVRLQGTNCTGLTNDMGYRLSRDSGDPDDTGHDFIPKLDGYSGQICAILESGSTPVDLCIAEW